MSKLKGYLTNVLPVGVVDRLEVPTASIRTFGDLKDVYSTLGDKFDEEVAYLMFRDVARPEDRELFEQHNIRYDITILLPHTVGQETTKTLGHYHPNKPGSEDSYTEIYQVISGKAYYILQSVEGESVDTRIIEANAGDVVYIPPNYGHITVNPTSEPLVMANLVERNFSSIYEPIVELGGASVIIDTLGSIIPNPKYGHLGLDVKLDKNDNLGIEGDIYTAFITNPDKFSILR